MARIPVPVIADLGITRDAILSAAAGHYDPGVTVKALLAAVAQELVTDAVQRLAEDGLAGVYETHELVCGDCPVRTLPEGEWSGEAADWVAELRASAAAALVEWGHPVLIDNVAQAGELWDSEECARTARGLAREFADRGRGVDADGRFLSQFGIVAADYEAGPPALPAPPAPPLSPEPAPPAPPLPPEPAPRGLPGEQVGPASLDDLVRAFGLLREGTEFDIAAIAPLVKVSASSLRNYLGGKPPRKLPRDGARALRVEVERRLELLTQAADIFGQWRG